MSKNVDANDQDGIVNALISNIQRNEIEDKDNGKR